MKSVSFFATLLVAAVVSFSATPAWAGKPLSSGECERAEMFVSAFKETGRQPPARELKILQQCREAWQQRAKQEAAQPKKVGLGWMFR